MIGKHTRDLINRIIVLILLFIGMVVVLTPLAWMLISALKSQDAVNTNPPQWIPTEQIKVQVNGRSAFLYDIEVDGVLRQLALIDKQGSTGTFANPEKPEEQYQLPVASGTRATRLYFHWENFVLAVTKVPFFHYLLNTLIIVLFGTLGTLVSCVLVAYGFARFRGKGLNTSFPNSSFYRDAASTGNPDPYLHFIQENRLVRYPLPVDHPCIFRQRLGRFSVAPIFHVSAHRTG